jgi:hypothetical protein
MLNLKKEREFKYYLKQLFENSDIDEELIRNITANILSNASRNSIDESIDYLKEQVKAENVPKDLADCIEKLLMRFSYWR